MNEYANTAFPPAPVPAATDTEPPCPACGGRGVCATKISPKHACWTCQGTGRTLPPRAECRCPCHAAGGATHPGKCCLPGPPPRGGE